MYREFVEVLITNPTVETFVIGDVDGVQTGDAGEVVLSSWINGDTATPDLTAPNLALSGRDHLTFRRITFFAFSDCIRTDWGGTKFSTDIKVEDCTVISVGGIDAPFLFEVDFNTAANITIDRCRFVSLATGLIFRLTGSSAGSDYDANILVRNCSFVCGGVYAIAVDAPSAQSKRGGGVTIRNCSFFAAAVAVGTANTSTTFPVTVLNCLIIGAASDWGSGVLLAAVSGQIVEDYNLIFTGFAPVNVTAGGHSHRDGSYAPMLDVGQEPVVGRAQRPFMVPSAGSVLLGYGGSNPPSVDLLNAPRPAGGASALAAVGAYERGNTFGKETGTVRSGTTAISITGPGYQDFALPVDAAPTTVTAYVRWDATYAGTKPRMAVLNGTECGVADATVTAGGSSGAWELLSLNFTPTAAGIVTIRFISSDTNGAGWMGVDDYQVS